jgi:Asp-tRNA(Asn)/Glu-tRNA(Gln) amidotransferase A subunit family amidase
MTRSRREFLATGGMGFMGAAMAVNAADAARPGGQASTTPGPRPPGAPPAFGTAPPSGPQVDAETFAQGEKLLQVEMTEAERAQAAGNWQQSMAAVYERRTGPHKLALEDTLPPATLWDPSLGPLHRPPVAKGTFRRSTSADEVLPASDDAVAFAPVHVLSRWIEGRRISSERLTQIYLERLKRYDPELRCVITLTEEHALAQARLADHEIAAGHYRGPLHGVPWGAKDLLDTAGIATTYGAEPYRDRVPSEDATVTRRLNAAGAVLVAKLSLGALALNDVWFGGQTKNPWLLVEGSSGSSAGPGAAVAAGLVGFAIGSETQGSIVSPSMRCGVTGLRPTYGRVPRTGAMTLSWTCDKLGVMSRGVEDTMLVLDAIAGPDDKDLACAAAALHFDGAASVRGLRVGYVPEWMNTSPATDVDRAAMETARRLGMELVAVSFPDWPYSSLNVILFAEAAAAFEELTLSRGVDAMKEQVADAWPNTFRQSRFLSAVDFVQADRLRRKVAIEFGSVMAQVDLLLVPSLRDEFLIMTNFTGHPSLTLRAGFVEVSQTRSDWAPSDEHPPVSLPKPARVPHGVSLVGHLFAEGTIAQAGIALEQAFGVSKERPQGF